MSVTLDRQPLLDNDPVAMLNLGKRYIAEADGCRYSVIVSRDDLANGRQIPDRRWHVSVAGENDVPRWEDLAAIGHRVRPGVCFVIGVPPKSWWINLHPHCLHLYELADDALIDQWRSERRGDTPS